MVPSQFGGFLIMGAEASRWTLLLLRSPTEHSNTMTEPNGHVAQHDDYSKGVEFTLSICICYTLSVLGLRLYVRWKTSAMDDSTLR